MFATDLPLEKEAETVGARRERKARERTSRPPSTGTSNASRSSSGSFTNERELWWSSSLKKAKIIKPKILRPSSGQSGSSKTTAGNRPGELATQKSREFKDPALQPAWTYTSSFATTLPSGNTFQVQEQQQIQELEGDTSSRQTSYTVSHSSHGRNDVITPTTVDSIDDACQPHKLSPKTFVTSRSRASSIAHEPVASVTSLVAELKGKDKTSPRPSQDEISRLEALELHDSFDERKISNDFRKPSNASSEISNMSNKPFSQWQCLTPREVPTGMQMKKQPQSQPSNTKLLPANGSPMQLTRFQRFIRRMESAGPKVILDRLKEDWEESTCDGVDEELILEKQLWLLTGLQMLTMGRDKNTPTPECDTGRILELYGNLSEVYQLSAMHPSQTVHFLSIKQHRQIPLPGNVSYSTVREFGAVPLPFPEEYFSHIRASTLPSLVPSAKLPEVFSECHKLLASGGFLEIRVIDAAPVRKTAGPLMCTWIEDRLLVNLERLFRCTKPCSLLPAWLTDAGFEMVDQHKDQKLSLPCASDPTSMNVDDELSTIIGRSLWKDIWGDFIGDSAGEPKWWWEDKDIVEECLRHKTMLECRTILAYKRSTASSTKR